MWRSRRSAILLATVFAVASCSPAGEPAMGDANDPTSPGTAATPTGPASAFPAPSSAADDVATLVVATQSRVHCPPIAPSLRADCGPVPLPKVRLAVTTAAGEVVTRRTGDDGTVRLPIDPGVVGVRGAPVSDDLSMPPLPVTVEVVPSQVQTVVLIYEAESQCRLRAELSARHSRPRTYHAGAGQPVITRGACP